MSVCKKWDVEKELITGNPDENNIEKKESRASKVNPTERQTTRENVPMIEEFPDEQTKNAYCRKATTQVRMSESEFHFPQNEFVIQTSKIDSGLHKVVPLSLRERILHVEHYALIAGHPGERQKYEKMPKRFFWLHMATDVSIRR